MSVISKRTSLCAIKLIYFLVRWKWFWAFDDVICHYFHVLITGNLIGDLLFASLTSSRFSDKEMFGIL